MSKYIVWIYCGSEGWDKSQELDTISECFEYLKSRGTEYIITKTVDIEFIDKDNVATPPPKEKS